MIKLDIYFTENDWKRMLSEGYDDNYGAIEAESSKGKYLIDIGFETKESYDVDGVCIEVYTLKEEGGHGEWFDSYKIPSRQLGTYQKFMTDAERFIKTAISCYEHEAQFDVKN